MHDVKTSLLQILQYTGQGRGHCGVNVVKQQYAFAARFKPFHRSHAAGLYALGKLVERNKGDAV